MKHLNCNICNNEILNEDNDLFYSTIIIDGKLNNTAHLCLSCFNKTGIEIKTVFSANKPLEERKALFIASLNQWENEKKTNNNNMAHLADRVIAYTIKEIDAII